MKKANQKNNSGKKKENNILTASCLPSKSYSSSINQIQELQTPQLDLEVEFSQFPLQRVPEWTQSMIEQNNSNRQEVYSEFKPLIESNPINYIKYLADIPDMSSITNARYTDSHGLVIKIRIPPDQSFHIVLKNETVLEFTTIFTIPNLYCYSTRACNTVNPFDLHRLKKLANIHNWSNKNAILYLRLFKM